MLYDYSLDKLEFSKLGNNHLTGIHTYDILRNPKYEGEFQYKPPSDLNRLDTGGLGDSDSLEYTWFHDKIKLYLNMSYMRDGMLESFNKPGVRIEHALRGLVTEELMIMDKIGDFRQKTAYQSEGSEE